MRGRIPEKTVAIYLGLGIVLGVRGLYAPAVGFDFINLDDTRYIVDNPMVSGGMTWPAVKAAWTTTTELYWAPLLWMSFMLEADLFHLEPWGFHLGNVMLFALNAGLFFVLVRRWSGRTGLALAVAGLWACHPARVESVAWVVERKDVLSGLFFLLGIGAYVEGRRGTLRQGVIWAWLCMALGGLAKQIVIVMPPILMLLDVWPLKRTDWNLFGRDAFRLAGEKWAFWMLALILAAVPVWLHQQAGVLMAVSWQRRFAMIPVHYFFYFQKTIWPSGLGVLLADPPFFGWQFAGGLLILAGGTWSLWRWRQEAPWALAGWLWFVGALFPLTGVVWGGAERVAVRFEYIPQMGGILAGVLAGDNLLRKWRRGWGWGAVAGVITAGIWVFLSLRLLPCWRDSYTIHTRVLQVNPDSSHAFDNIGQACFQAGKLTQWQEFMERYRQERPGRPFADIQYAWWLAAMTGDAEASEKTVEGITSLSPDNPGFWTWLDERSTDTKLLGLWRDTAGICLRQRGDWPRMETLRARWAGEWDARTQSNFLAELMLAYWTAGKDAEAAKLARELNPTSGMDVPEQEMLLRFLSRWQQGARGYAFACFQDYVRRRPDDGMALNNMAWLLATTPPDELHHARMNEWPAVAMDWAQRALTLGGDGIPGVWDTLAAARANAGDFTGALAAVEKALDLAREAGALPLVSLLELRREQYRLGKPWREAQTDLTPGGKRVK